VIGVVTGMVTSLENATPIVMIEIIRTDDEDVEAGHEVTVMMIIIVRKSDDIAVEVEVIQKKEIENSYPKDLLPMEK
jgi:ribosomal protein L21